MKIILTAIILILQLQVFSSVDNSFIAYKEINISEQNLSYKISQIKKTFLENNFLSCFFNYMFFSFTKNPLTDTFYKKILFKHLKFVLFQRAPPYCILYN